MSENRSENHTMTKEYRSTRWRRGWQRQAAIWMAATALGVMVPLVHAQTTVGGIVLEATTRTPVEGVRVVAEGTPRGAMTDNRGRFVITGLTGTDANLRVNRIGFRELRQS